MTVDRAKEIVASTIRLPEMPTPTEDVITAAAIELVQTLEEMARK